MTASYSRFNDEFDPHYLGMACDSEHYSFISWLTFSWIGRLIAKGDQKRLKNTNDLFDLPEWLTPVHVSSKVEEVFRHHSSVSATSPIHLPADHQSRVPRLSLLQALHKCYGKQFYGVGLLKFFADIFAFISPVFLNLFITFISNHDEPNSRGYLYMIGLVSTLLTSKNLYFINVTIILNKNNFVCLKLRTLFKIFLGSIFSAHYDYQIHMIGIKIRGTLITMIYKKTLELNTVMLNNFR